MSLGRILRAVHAAIIRHDPTLAAERAAAAAESRGVWRVDDPDGVSTLTVVADTPDAAAFDTTLHEVADALGALGDARPERVRRAAAVGVLADPQSAFTLLADPTGGKGGADGADGAGGVRRGPVFHLHLHWDTLTAYRHAPGSQSEDVGDASGVVRIPGLGARSVQAVESWLAGLGAQATIEVTPIIDLGDHISVDAYEVPDRLRRQVAARDHGCVFPWCGRQGRFDVDHIDPYVLPDDGGPPHLGSGQTSTANTARLCRFHHGVKTHGGWRYLRAGPTELVWTSPHGRRYTVDHHGTRRT